MIDVSDICRMTLEAEDVRSKLDCWKKTCKEKRLALKEKSREKISVTIDT